MITLKHSYYGICVSGDVNLGPGGILLLNGIENVPADAENSEFGMDPFPGTISAGEDIIYEGISFYKILNGSKLIYSGSIPAPSNGITIPDNFLKPNQSVVSSVEDWTLLNPTVTGGDPVTFPTVVISTANIENTGVSSIVRPAFNPTFGTPTPAIPDNERFVMDTVGMWVPVLDDTFVNGSLYIEGFLDLNATLFVNGTLKCEGVRAYSKGKIIATGFIGDTGSPDYGLSIDFPDSCGHRLTGSYYTIFS